MYRWYLIRVTNCIHHSRENSQETSLGSEPEDSPRLRGHVYKEENQEEASRKGGQTGGRVLMDSSEEYCSKIYTVRALSWWDLSTDLLSARALGRAGCRGRGPFGVSRNLWIRRNCPPEVSIADPRGGVDPQSKGDQLGGTMQECSGLSYVSRVSPELWGCWWSSPPSYGLRGCSQMVRAENDKGC